LQKYLYTEKFKIGKPRMELALTRGFCALKSKPEAARVKLPHRRSAGTAFCGGLEGRASIFFRHFAAF
jgi:hypothetical protein